VGVNSSTTPTFFGPSSRVSPHDGASQVAPDRVTPPCAQVIWILGNLSLAALVCISEDIQMKRVSMQCSLLIAAFAVASDPAALSAQSENLISAKTINQSIGAWNATTERNSAASDPHSGERIVPASPPMLRPGTPRGPGQVPLIPWSTLADTPRGNSKPWTKVGPGSLPLAVAIQPDATQKYGANPGILQFYFGRRP
jgi:hypothetical protein